MQTATITTADNPNVYKITGVVNFVTVTALVRQAYDIIHQQLREIIFDFSGVTQSNSAGLAFLIALVREAKKQKKALQFLHLPVKLIAAAKISDLDQLLCIPTT